ncbi:portal protein [Malaciobacter molluscorum LMG 25693]|uniref:Glutathione-regulated potassium-efflux system protein, KefB/KefC family n=1 Tax=Malaciobacter molluscorum LMG 25693 TaxID=870501 RepID=A0A2G1DKJ9_9BACT|nr:monovalent cation:proton antiporter-2 (CPA2) family protein [Malaciobacter molluscorum]AXX92576.1 glutathione-regulated potassium-efflux system protein, KefB/KefC family [Malaciobacter molluscorum LMG 25693]PHO19001.1 portal protein [Malaciobacter molluscorum LMG 25693]
MENSELLNSTLYLFAVATILVALSKKLGLGSILGLLIAGVIVGPYSAGPILTDKVEVLRHITEFGVVLLLFVIGLEMQPKKLWSMRKEVFGLGTAQILFSGFLIFLYWMFYSKSWQVALLVGLTFALSSTAFVMQILQEKGELYTPKGKSGFSILLMQDLAVVPLLALVPILAEKGQLSKNHSLFEQIVIALFSILALVAIGKYVIPKVLDYLAKNQNREAFFFSIMLSVIFAAWAMEHAGLSMALGAFIMGMMLSSSKYHYQIQANVEPYKGILMTMFFVAVGMSIDINAMMSNPLILIQHLFVILGIKIVALFLLMIFMKYNKSTAISVSFLLSQSGEFGFVLFGAAKALGVIDDELFIAAITIISFSMLLTPMVVSLGDKLALKLENEPIAIQSNYVPEDSWKGVVVAGYGRVGRTICTMFEHAHISYVAFDINSSRVELGQREQRPVYYGELSELDFLNKIGLDRVEAIILTVDNHRTTIKMISHIRSLYPTLMIFARTKDMKSRDALIKHGATWGMPESIEGSLRLGAETLFKLGMTREEVFDILTYFRKDDYETIKEIHKHLDKKEE